MEYMDNNMKDAMEMKLWNYIDDTLPANEKAAVEKLLAENQQWKDQYSQLLEVQQLLKESELEEPSLRFTTNVMDEIAKLQIAPATKAYLNKNIIRGIAGFFVVMILAVLFFAFSQTTTASTTSSNTTTDKYINSINWSQFLNTNWITGFMIVNVILAMFLLDRFLASKRKKFQHK